MEEASGTDLDWFWRGWFYTTDHVDISLDSIYKLRLDTENPDIDLSRRRQELADEPEHIGARLNREQGLPIWVLENPGITDFYDENDRFTVTPKDTKKYESCLEGLEDWERRVFDRAVEEDNNYYALSFSNIGGLVMPIILDLRFTDGTSERMMIPAEIWRRNSRNVGKLLVFPKSKELREVVLDPEWETADADINNNYYPRRIIDSRVEAFKRPDPTSRTGRDLMAEVLVKEEDKKEEPE